MPTATYRVSALSDFVNRVFRLRETWEQEDIKHAKECEDDDDPDPLQVWFRGQENARWRLVPKLYRLKTFNENEIRTEFKLRGFQLMSESHIPKDDREW